MFATIRPRPEGDLWVAQADGISPALLFNPNQVRETWRALQNALPQVTLYYTVKSNPYHSLLATLVDEGAAFDVASARNSGVASFWGFNKSNDSYTPG